MSNGHVERASVASQEIFHIDGTPFHLHQHIRQCRREICLGGGGFDSVKPLHLPLFVLTLGHSWTRVFEVGPECVADTKTIEAIFNLAESQYKYLEKIYEENQNSLVGRWVQPKLLENRKAHAELYEAWMDATWACILCKKIFLTSGACIDIMEPTTPHGLLS
jgi:hypothetical protein